ncbi:MAG: DNA-binding protein WhiA [Bacilli bacterium]|nr:DNA-binding protein WhiA [Bacilli bacterium]
MSFTTTVKNEVCMLELSNSENISELSGFVRASSKIYDDRIELTTENAKVAKRIYLLIKSIYGIEVLLEQRKMANFSNKKIYVVTIESKVSDILNDLSVMDESPKDYIVGSNEEIKSYLRGTFFNRGSVNDPKTSQYHLEFVYDNKHEAVFVQRLLNMFDMNSKIIIRDTKYMVYIKEAEKISDFLKLISAYQAVLYYENIRIYKEQKNNTNRLNNCEQANIDKIIETCNSQISDIELIMDKLGIEFLDDKIKEACEYRLKYPETSLTELSKIISLETNSNITKSGLNHRFRKIRDIASRLRDK